MMDRDGAMNEVSLLVLSLFTSEEEGGISKSELSIEVEMDLPRAPVRE